MSQIAILGLKQQERFFDISGLEHIGLELKPTAILKNGIVKIPRTAWLSQNFDTANFLKNIRCSSTHEAKDTGILSRIPSKRGKKL